MKTGVWQRKIRRGEEGRGGKKGRRVGPGEGGGKEEKKER